MSGGRGMKFLGWSNTLYGTLHVNLVQLAFAPMSGCTVLYTAISVFYHLPGRKCLSCRDAASSLAFGPYTMQGVSSAPNLPPSTTRIVSIKLNAYKGGSTHSSHLVLAISQCPHLVVHHHLDQSIMCGIRAHSTLCNHVCHQTLHQLVLCSLGPELGLQLILCLQLQSLHSPKCCCSCSQSPTPHPVVPSH